MSEKLLYWKMWLWLNHPRTDRYTSVHDFVHILLSFHYQKGILLSCTEIAVWLKHPSYISTLRVPFYDTGLWEFLSMAHRSLGGSGGVPFCDTWTTGEFMFSSHFCCQTSMCIRVLHIQPHHVRAFMHSCLTIFFTNQFFFSSLSRVCWEVHWECPDSLD